MSANNKKIRGLLISLVVITIPWLLIFAIKNKISDVYSPKTVEISNYSKDSIVSHVSHKDFEILKQEFTSPEQVTLACITCHNQRDNEIMHNAHWTWDRETLRENGEKVRIGKRNIVNNYCISTNNNTWECTNCHIGYGYKDNTFDFKDASKVDCIVCHDNTGTYEKQPLASGYPAKEKKRISNKTYFPPNYNYIAQNVGSPERDNCGKCHFFGGGGDNVKHGDLSSDLFHPNKAMDVHMAEEGQNMSCIECHETQKHVMLGKAYSVSSTDENRMECEKCHTDEPHSNRIINNHLERIACQTCHIPIYAKGTSTKMEWDWSTTGKLDEVGKVITEKDSTGKVTYSTPKGTFKWQSNVEPEYVWFNGTASHYVYGDKIKDTTEVLQINILNGSFDDKKAKIIPVKVHRGRQIFDPINKILIVPHVYGHDSTAYKEGLDWNLASKSGMEAAGLPYSGKYSFISTEMYWPLNHMVAEANQSLSCTDCHSPNGRMKNLAGFYMPGRDRSKLFDVLGVLMVAFSIMGVSIHGLIRYIKKDCIACS